MPIFRSDRNLLDRFRKGAPDAMGTVYWEYVGKIERLVSQGFQIRSRGTRMGGAGSRQDLADLVQETFARAFSEKIRLSFDASRDYGPYLFAIARNVLVDWMRANGREIAIAWADIEQAVEALPHPQDGVPWAEPTTLSVVEEYLRGLPQDLRDVHRLRYEEGLSQIEAAARLSVGRQTLRTLEGRLRDGLSAALDAVGL